jgi:hypothetical protein
MDPLSCGRHGERPTLPASSSFRHAAPPDSSWRPPPPPTTGKRVPFLSFFIFLSTEEYNCIIFLGTGTDE